MVAILVLTGVLATLVTVGIARFDSLTGEEIRARATDEALLRAKEALLAYAVTYAETHGTAQALPGMLPCPDRLAGGQDGVADPGASACGDVDENAIGRLPWHTLDIPPLRDASGECLWYAVAGRHKARLDPQTHSFTAADQSTQRGLLNWHTPGQLNLHTFNGTARLRVTGTEDPDRGVAVIIAPGPATGTQDRTTVAGTAECRGNYAASNYLDRWVAPASLDPALSIDNAALDSAPAGPGAQSDFFEAPGDRQVNDRMLVITARELWAAMWRSSHFRGKVQALTREVARCIADWRLTALATDCATPANPADGRLPWPAPMDLPGEINSLNYGDQPATLFGRVPFLTSLSNADTGKCRGTLARDRLLGSAGAGGKCATWSAETDIWYANWKDQLLYALSGAFTPSSGSGPNCGAGQCVSLGGQPAAAVVLFAGPPLAGQTRATSAARELPQNYLETPNLAGSAAPGTGAYAAAGAAPFNDRIACAIPPDLGTPSCSTP